MCMHARMFTACIIILMCVAHSHTAKAGFMCDKMVMQLETAGHCDDQFVTAAAFFWACQTPHTILRCAGRSITDSKFHINRSRGMDSVLHIMHIMLTMHGF